jgi:hypothetical protein
MLVCLLTELNIQLTGGPAVGGAVQVRAIKGMAENQESESAGSDTVTPFRTFRPRYGVVAPPYGVSRA